jgi:NAD(P)H-nitrite reductase large subunit
VLSGDRLVGALVVGEQSLADPLRDLIEQQVDIRPLRPHLQEGGQAMTHAVMEFWKQAHRQGSASQPAPEAR